jgi:transposase InsO family protein
MRRDVDQYVRECDECQRQKQTHEYRAPLGEVRKPTYPFEISGMDICGPYNRTPRGNKYLLTFIDHFFKYTEAIPIPDMTAEVCARAYATQIVARHGAGSVLVTDQGRQFMSTFFQETCRILGVKHINTSAWHPQGNGVSERFHKTMHQGLSHYVNDSGTNWDTLINFYLMAYRATPHGTTGFSPHYLLHAREMVLPTTQNIAAKLSPDMTDTDQVAKLENLKSSLKTAYKLVRQNIDKSYQSNKRHYDRKAKQRTFSADDVVYLFCPATKPGQCRKFQKKWAGPFRIVTQVSKLNYRIEKTGEAVLCTREPFEESKQ